MAWRWWNTSRGTRAPVAPRTYRGNMCGLRVAGLPPIPGGANDPALVISWLVFRYGPSDRRRIYTAWLDASALDVLVSWPDAADAGWSGSQFVAWCQELVDAGFRPCVMLCAKPTSSENIRDIDGTLAEIMRALPLLLALPVVSRVCVGWELSLWLSPTDVQVLIDALSPLCLAAGVPLFVHFQQGYGSFQQPGKTFADFWNPNVGKLTGLLHQKVLTQTHYEYWFASGGLFDILDRFAGNANCSPDSGFGHPFDCIALEITAMTQFDGQTSEKDGDAFGQWAIECPKAFGSAGSVGVMGSGNGQID